MTESLPNYLFHQGTNYKSYKYFGAHLCEKDGEKGVTFRVWAPSAFSVRVIGDFNGWNKEKGEMSLVDSDGVYELFVKGAKEFDKYKFLIKSSKGEVAKADPYAFFAEVKPKTASVIYDVDGYVWSDEAFCSNRDIYGGHNRPMNIYEVNLGSFLRKPNGDYYSYNDYADILVKYVKKNGYNYVEIMPINECPFDGSWGYQVTGYFAITSRFGTPKEFMALVDAFHREGIGVIVDWVPAHFPKDEHGLFEFDGGPLYEAHGWDRIEHKNWGTRRFDYGRTEIQSFLVSSASFLFEKYHIDGIRVDAVAAMIYLDYEKAPGEWIPNIYGENKNLEAISLIQKLNAEIHRAYPYAIMIAEESTALAGVTKPVSEGGLGFDYKWNMGWMNDILSYVEIDPFFRKYDHNKLTFSLVYAFSEHFILPISHDEVVHGKKSLLDKQFGSYEEKFSGVRALMGYMMSHPGKKLTFMGSEFGQFKEWNYEEGLEFFLKKYPSHDSLSVFFRELNNFYLNTPALYGDDDGWNGFSWVAADERDKNFVAYKRFYNGEELLAIINFSGSDLDTEIESSGIYDLVFSSDKARFGGADKYKKRVYKSIKRGFDGKDVIKINLNALSFIYLKKR
ncbi:MAG: 1,4-alpha-glucan branching protein GlgB [Clostridia bacterium]|nr:1,4-alpha-glucan branching protein GlgB [Clostridia bacterium]